MPETMALLALAEQPRGVVSSSAETTLYIVRPSAKICGFSAADLADATSRPLLAFAFFLLPPCSRTKEQRVRIVLPIFASLIGALVVELSRRCVGISQFEFIRLVSVVRVRLRGRRVGKTNREASGYNANDDCSHSSLGGSGLTRTL
jgi:hypothetical protein